MVKTAVYTDADRFRELVTHARDGSPIATESVRLHLRKRLLDVPPAMLLAIAERMVEIELEKELAL